MKKRIVFFGTPQFAAEILSYLLRERVNIVGVVTQPDRAQGRSALLIPSEVKQVVEGKEIPILQPQTSSDLEFLKRIEALQADLYVVVAFGQILPQNLLDIPPMGSINVHASLLPKYRGAAPMQRCLIAGDRQTGVVVQKMVKQLDAGDVIATATISLDDTMTFGELRDRLCQLSKPLLLSVLQLFEQGIPEGIPQDPTKVTFAPKIESQEGLIDWNLPAQTLHNLIRGLSPKPGASCFFTPIPLVTQTLAMRPNQFLNHEKDKIRLKIFKSTVVKQQGTPGQWLSKEALIACGENALLLLEVQPEGKKKMSGADWLRGFHIFPKMCS